MKKELTCITCPMGCHLEAEISMEGDTLTVLSVTGNTCSRGEKYARAELTHPERMVTSTVAIEGAPIRRLPVITSAPVPKERIFDVCKAIEKAKATSPVRIGEVIIPGVCGLPIDIVASRSL